MKILIIGDQKNFDEFRNKFGTQHEYTHVGELRHLRHIQDQHFIFDFTIDSNIDHLDFYRECREDTTIFLNTVKISLGELFYIHEKPSCNVYGFNGLPTFLNREVLEISALTPEIEEDSLKECLENLGAEFMLVEDRVGMVTPRVIFMIINEAYYTVQEGTATREDIDLGMKLGTNYPYGPFEWSKQVGVHHVYETLEALYEDTKEERYKIAPLLKKEYMAL